MRNRFVTNTLLALIAVIITSCYRDIVLENENENAEAFFYINHNEVFFDTISKVALCPVNNFDTFKGILSFNKLKNVSINNQLLNNGECYKFDSISNNKKFNLSFIDNNNQSQQYVLNLTLLPIVHIKHKAQYIPDEPKIIANISISDPISNTTINEICGIERRGGSALYQPKKSYNFEIRNPNDVSSSKNSSLFNLFNDDDWILDAAYTDKSNTRNRISFLIWEKIQNSSSEKGYNNLKSGIKGEFVELFINNKYNGLYCLSERTDEKKLGLKDTEYSKGSYLYKSEDWSPATTLSGLPDTIGIFTNWSHWLQKHPNPEIKSCWKPIYDYVDFVYSATDSTFKSQISDYININQAIDYFILINIIQGRDNAGKNIFMAQTANSPFYICPWDMDATWGRDWMGEPYLWEEFISFNLYRRLMKTNPNDFNTKLKERWFELRKDELKIEAIINYFEKYSNKFIVSGAYNREKERWPKSMNDSEIENEYIEKWLSERVDILDELFYNLE